MQTHSNNLVLVTASGQPVRPAHVIACTDAKNDTGLRIVMDTGEVVRDDWPTAADAKAFQRRLRFAMQGLVHVPDPDAPLALPAWATYKNAAIAAQAVDEVGGTREHAVQVYARTLFGEGEPASAIDGASMMRAFDDASPGGPIYVLAGMPSPDHSQTKLPFMQHSPLVGLAIVAVDQGSDPQRVRFVLPDRPEDYRVTADEYDSMTPAERAEYEARLQAVRRYDEDIGRAVAVTIGEAHDRAFRRLCLPRKVYYHCALARRFFGEWVGFHGPLVEHKHTEYTGSFDSTNAAHRTVLQMLAEHFEAQGWTAAAAQLRSELAG